MHRLSGLRRALSLEVRAFTRHGRECCRGNRAATAARAALALCCYRRRELPDGQAVCLVGLDRRRTAAFMVVAGAATMVLGTLLPVGAVVLAVALAGLLGPGALQASGAGRKGRGAVGSGSPTGAVYVHWLASEGGGAGARLLSVLAAEARLRGTSLVVDAACPRLVAYYEGFGFSVVGRVPARRGGYRTRLVLGARVGGTR